MPLTITKILEAAKRDPRSPEEQADAFKRVIKAFNTAAMVMSSIDNIYDSLFDGLWEAAKQAIEDMGGSPQDKRWRDVPYVVIFELAEVARDAKELGLTVTVQPPNAKRKPGRKATSPEKKMELYWQFEQRGTSQSQFAAYRDVTPNSVYEAVKWCEENKAAYEEFRKKKKLGKLD